APLACPNFRLFLCCFKTFIGFRFVDVCFGLFCLIDYRHVDVGTPSS
ncbi:hypothetical protein LINPERPRIM_LOCUS35180, partial [Linum perenne]